MKANPEFDRFTDTMEKLIKVPHSEIKAVSDAEKKAKKRKKSRKSSASREGV
jgi:hypothetical protein